MNNNEVCSINIELTPLIEAFKLQTQLDQKCLAVFGEGACSIQVMELAIKEGFTSDNLVFGAFNTSTKKEWEFAHVELNSDGTYLVSSDMPMTGVQDIVANTLEDVVPAVCKVLNQLMGSQNTSGEIATAIKKAVGMAEAQINHGKLLKLSQGECSIDEDSFYTIASDCLSDCDIENFDGAQDKIVSALAVKFPEYAK